MYVPHKIHTNSYEEPFAGGSSFANRWFCPLQLSAIKSALILLCYIRRYRLKMKMRSRFFEGDNARLQFYYKKYARLQFNLQKIHH